MSYVVYRLFSIVCPLLYILYHVSSISFFYSISYVLYRMSYFACMMSILIWKKSAFHRMSSFVCHISYDICCLTCLSSIVFPISPAFILSLRPRSYFLYRLPLYCLCELYRISYIDCLYIVSETSIVFPI